MNAADFARQSDPTRNPQFRRGWHEMPRRIVRIRRIEPAATMARAWRNQWRAERAAVRREARQ